MWRRYAYAVFLAMLGLKPMPAHAQAMEAVSVGGKAMEWLGITPDQAAILTHLLESSRDVAQHTNELLNYARASRQAAEILRHLSFEDLQQESQARLLEAFPELQQIDANVDAIVLQSDALMRHAEADARTGSRRDQARRLAKFAGEAALWPRFFDQARRGADYAPTSTDLFVQRRYQDTYMVKQRAFRGAVVQTLLAQTQMLYRDSLLKDDMLVRSGAIMAQASVQSMNDTGEILEHKRQEVALEERMKSESEAHRVALLRLVAKNAASGAPKGP